MLKKALSLLLLGSVAVTSVSAADNTSVVSSTRFIGVEVGVTDVQGETLFDPSNSGTDVSYGLRIGAKEGVWRTAFLFNYYDNTDDDMNVETMLLTVDYFFLENTSSVQPYLGLNVGYANYESTGIDDSDFLYGGQAGLLFDVSSDFDLDLSYRYSLTNMDVMDHAGSLMLSVDYKF
jgi:opacity protein-like surface antigen